MDDDRIDPAEEEARRQEPFFNPGVFEALPVILLLGSFIAIHLWSHYGGYAVQAGLLRNFAFISAEFWRGEGLYKLVSYAFLHGDWLHLGMNGAAFFGLGAFCWRWMGTSRFLLFFVLTAIAGAVAFAAVRPESGPLVGASGAIFGLLAAFKRIEFKQLANRGVDVRRSLASFVFQIVGLNLVLGFATGGMMAWEAHLGGMALGWFLTPYLMKS